jgi:phosphonate transport system ATP-binding protein
MDILADMNRRDGITVLVSLHQVEYALSYCPRTIGLKAGKVVYDGPSDALTPALLCSIYGAEVSELFAHGFEPAGTQRQGDGSAAVATADALPIDEWIARRAAQKGRTDRLTA